MVTIMKRLRLWEKRMCDFQVAFEPPGEQMGPSVTMQSTEAKRLMLGQKGSLYTRDTQAGLTINFASRWDM